MPNGAWLLDVREDDEWAAGYAPGARHIPLGQLGARTAEIPQDQTVYVICRSGVRSARAAQALAAAGWEAINVAGGMQDWAAAQAHGHRLGGRAVRRVTARRLPWLLSLLHPPTSTSEYAGSQGEDEEGSSCR